MNTEMYRTDGLGGLTRLHERDSRPLSTSVRIDVTAAALNFRDIPFIRGNEDRKPTQHKMPLSEAVGLVSAVGEERLISRWSIDVINDQNFNLALCRSEIQSKLIMHVTPD